jgi:hypothetical protein
MSLRTLQISVLFIALASCSTVYKSGQTPDDVYYSPANNRPDYVEKRQTKERYNNYEDVDVSDRYLRMKLFSRSRWSSFDYDYNYWNDPYWNNQNYYNYNTINTYIGYGPGYNNVNPFHAGFYGTPVVIMHPIQKDPRANAPRNFNLNTYSGSNGNATLITDPKTGNKTITISSPRSNEVKTFSNGNVGRFFNAIMSEGSSGSSNTRFFNPSSSNNNSSNNSSSSTRSTNSSSSSSSSPSSSSSSSSSSSTAPVRTFPKGGNNQ